jgi:hypothetical protein
MYGCRRFSLDNAPESAYIGCMKNSYYVIQPIMSLDQPDWAESATIISRHRSQAAADLKIARATARLRRQPGQAQSWLDWHVVEADRLSAKKRARFAA